MTRKGWPRESARHSLAGRGVRTKRQRSQHPSTVATGQQKNLPKEQSSPEEPLEMACAELETAAITEAGEEDAAKLLSDDEWLATHIEKVIAGFELNDGIKTTLIAKLREKYTVDGD